MQKPKVIEISETLFEIPELGHTIKIHKKIGRTIMTCSCQNDARFCNESPFCYDKQLVTEFIALKPINNTSQNNITVVVNIDLHNLNLTNLS